MRISDWSSDVCSSDLQEFAGSRWNRRRFSGCRCCIAIIDPALGDWFRRRGQNAPANRGRTRLRCTCLSCQPYAYGDGQGRSEERRVGKEWSVRVDLGGRRIIKKKRKTYRYMV